MFLRHTREDENGARALITVGADQQSFKTTDCTDITQISTDESWIPVHSRREGIAMYACAFALHRSMMQRAEQAGKKSAWVLK
jgi:hypothetical protein